MQKSNIKNVELPLCGSDFLNFAFCTLMFELNEECFIRDEIDGCTIG